MADRQKIPVCGRQGEVSVIRAKSSCRQTSGWATEGDDVAPGAVWLVADAVVSEGTVTGAGRVVGARHRLPQNLQLRIVAVRRAIPATSTNVAPKTSLGKCDKYYVPLTFRLDTHMT